MKPSRAQKRGTESSERRDSANHATPGQSDATRATRAAHLRLIVIARSLQEDILRDLRDHLADFNDPLRSFRLQIFRELRHILIRICPRVRRYHCLSRSLFTLKVSRIHRRESLDAKQRSGNDVPLLRSRLLLETTK